MIRIKNQEPRTKTNCHFEQSEKSHYVILRFLFFMSIVLVFISCKQQPNNIKLSGPVFGTSFSIIYEGEVNYQDQFDSLFYVINKSMSTYQVNSDISKLNRNQSNSVDEHFIKVFNTSKKIYKETQGAFDPTIGAVVNAWDFGPEGKIVGLDSLKIDSLMFSVGLDKVYLIENKIAKPLNSFIDFNAIAKGYGVDVISEFLESQEVLNYLVEIGGEIRCKGMNTEKQSNWTVGIDRPNFDDSQSVLKAISLKNESMATSGTYRKFKVDESGNRYAHIINTKTGFPSKTNILSVSVLAKHCMTADAYATAFQAMGIESVTHFLRSHPELKVFFVFENDENQLETLTFNGFPE